MSEMLQIPYEMVQDEDRVWCASAQLAPGVAAYGDGATQEEASASLREGLLGLIAEVGAPVPIPAGGARPFLEIEIGGIWGFRWPPR